MQLRGSFQTQGSRGNTREKSVGGLGAQLRERGTSSQPGASFGGQLQSDSNVSRIRSLNAVSDALSQ